MLEIARNHYIGDNIMNEVVNERWEPDIICLYGDSEY